MIHPTNKVTFIKIGTELVLYKKPFFIFWVFYFNKKRFFMKKKDFVMCFFRFLFFILFFIQYLAFYYLNS